MSRQSLAEAVQSFEPSARVQWGVALPEWAQPQDILLDTTRLERLLEAAGVNRAYFLPLRDHDRQEAIEAKGMPEWTGSCVADMRSELATAKLVSPASDVAPIADWEDGMALPAASGLDLVVGVNVYNMSHWLRDNGRLDDRPEAWARLLRRPVSRSLRGVALRHQVVLPATMGSIIGIAGHFMTGGTEIFMDPTPARLAAASAAGALVYGASTYLFQRNMGRAPGDMPVTFAPFAVDRAAYVAATFMRNRRFLEADQGALHAEMPSDRSTVL
jgi:hypothetical protein